MSDNSFKVKNSLALAPVNLATLLNPQAGDLACDINDNNKIKRYDEDAASWVEVGSGGGVGGVDIFFVQDFESASLSSFDSQVGLSLSQTDPLKGKVSAVLTHDSSIDQLFKQIIPVDRKFRGIPMVLRLDSKSSASQGNLVIKITDETNSFDIITSAQLQLSSEISGKKNSVVFTIPSDCENLSYTITALPEAGSPESVIDDIICEIAEIALLATIPESQALKLTGGSAATTTTITNFSVDENSGSNICSYNSSNGRITFNKACIASVTFIATQTTASADFYVTILKNGSTLINNVATRPSATGGYTEFVSTSISMSAGDYLTFQTGAIGNINSSVFLTTTAASESVLTVPETFSTDTAALSYKSSSEYTLSTLENAPVGSYITFTYAANTNTRTQTTTRPTQSDADMNANGIRIFTRAFNAASTAGNPARIAIQIGKGLKGRSLDLYKSAGKSIGGNLDWVIFQSDTNSRGAFSKDYNEVTGVLSIDAGVQASSSNINAAFNFSDTTVQNNGYLVINASKNPALTGIGLDRVACVCKTAPSTALTYTGTLANTSTVTWTWNTIEVDTHGAYNTSTGTFTAPSSGTYMIGFNVYLLGSYASYGRVDSFINVNGTSVHFEVGYISASSGALQIFGCKPVGIKLNKGDTVTCSSVPSNWSSVSVGISNPTSHRLTIFKVG